MVRRWAKPSVFAPELPGEIIARFAPAQSKRLAVAMLSPAYSRSQFGAGGWIVFTFLSQQMNASV